MRILIKKLFGPGNWFALERLHIGVKIPCELGVLLLHIRGVGEAEGKTKKKYRVEGKFHVISPRNELKTIKEWSLLTEQTAWYIFFLYPESWHSSFSPLVLHHFELSASSLMYFTSVKALQHTFLGFFVIVLFSLSNFIEREFAANGSFYSNIHSSRRQGN